MMGLEGYVENDDDPFSGRVDMLYSWPFPQFIRGERYNFLVIRDSVVNHEDLIYMVSDTYTVGHIFNCPVAIYGLGTLMEVADFAEYAFMTNGVIMIYWDVGLADWHEVRSTATIPMMRTVCNFKGQMVGGNVLGVWNLGTLVYDQWHECNETFYIWSNIGEADFTPGQSNLAGFRRDPYGGEVYHVRRLGDGVIGYSSKGVIKMTPVIEPAPTFGFTELDDVGLINQGAIDGDLHRQIYVGSDYRIREVTSKGVKLLGYHYYIDDLNGNEPIIVKYDRIKKDFYISNDEETYLLSPYGLTEVSQHPSALWSIDEHYEGPVMLPNTEDDYDPLIATEMCDMGYRGQKTIFSMESDVLLALEPEVMAFWLNTLGVWGDTGYIPLNDQGVASVIIDGADFAFGIKFTELAVGLRLNYMKVRYKMTDLRGLRGVYAPPPRGQR